MSEISESHLSDVEFASLDLDERLKQGLADAGFSHCTPIQAESLPVALRGDDVAGQAQTGTGKTAAFLLATFNLLLRDENPELDRNLPRAIVIAPTRELAAQIYADGVSLSKHTDLKLALAYGGTDYEKQREIIAAGIDVLIGTPGRLIDYFKQGVYPLDKMQVVVLDEADRMFDLGFIKDMRYLLRRMPDPSKRLNMLFSATLSHRVMELAYEHMNDPSTVRIESDRTVAENVTEIVYYPGNSEKIPLMLGLMKKHETGRTLVFTNTRHGAEKVGDWLTANDHRAAVLTGDVPQRKREALLRAFTNGTRDILVATDVAARGLHIPDVSHVFNYDLPQDAEDYVHRIGRTARAGASGDAISFACEDYAFHLMEIEEYIGHQIPRGDIDAELLVEAAPPKRRERKSRDKRGESDNRGGRRDSDTRGGRRTKSSRTRPEERQETKRPATEPAPIPAEAAKPAEPEAEEIMVNETANPSDVSSAMRPRNSKWNNPNIDIPAVG